MVMREVTGDIWVYDGRKDFILLVTTNGSIRKDGCGVMGRGVALEAAQRYPDLPRLLGFSLKCRGNVVSLIQPGLYAFPVKHKWREAADLTLIKESTKRLEKIAREHPNKRYVLPRPGCGNGNLDWDKVKKIVEILPDNVLVIQKG
jgi:hypothetical protein